MALKVHGPPLSPNVGRVLIVLYEKDVDFELVPVDLPKGEHKSPEFLKLQPFGQIPAVTLGDFTMFESRAIARTIAHKYEGQGTPLYGSYTVKDKALVEQWIEVEGQTFSKPTSVITFNLVFAPKFGMTTDDKAVADALVKLESILDVYEKHLSTSKYLAGDFYSLADADHLPLLYYLLVVAKKGELVDSRPALKAWWEDISSRPALKKWVALI